MTPKFKRALKKLVKSELRGHDYLASRQQFAKQITELAEGGQIAIVWSGMDCDCVRWGGKVDLFPAIPRLVMRDVEHEYEHAEGHLSHQIFRPSEAAEIEYHARDLIMEAYENGRGTSVCL